MPIQATVALVVDDQTVAESFEGLLAFLNRLDAAGVSYTLAHTRPESIMVDLALPSWRWEVEFMHDDTVEIERCRSVAGVEADEKLLDEIFRDLLRPFPGIW